MQTWSASVRGSCTWLPHRHRSSCTAALQLDDHDPWLHAEVSCHSSARLVTPGTQACSSSLWSGRQELSADSSARCGPHLPASSWASLVASASGNWNSLSACALTSTLVGDLSGAPCSWPAASSALHTWRPRVWTQQGPNWVCAGHWAGGGQELTSSVGAAVWCSDQPRRRAGETASREAASGCAVVRQRACLLGSSRAWPPSPSRISAILRLAEEASVQHLSR